MDKKPSPSEQRRREDALIVGRLLVVACGVAIVGLVDVFQVFDLALRFIGLAGIFAVMLGVCWLIVLAVDFFCYPEDSNG